VLKRRYKQDRKSMASKIIRFDMYGFLNRRTEHAAHSFVEEPFEICEKDGFDRRFLKKDVRAGRAG
jgi:hypothetical protein